MDTNKIIMENILDAPPNVSANLVILNLSYNFLKSVFTEMVDVAAYLRISKSIIKKSHAMTGDDGMCCAIAIDEKDSKGNTLNPLGTMVIQDVDPWHVSDEIIWSKNPQNLASDTDPLKPQKIDFEEDPFSQIWVLEKQKKETTSDLPFMYSSTKNPDITDSVWSIPPKSQPGYRDPLPSELLTRLISTYSRPGDLVLDPFAGHGMTALVCRSLGSLWVIA